MKLWTSVLCAVAGLGCNDSGLPVHHVSPPVSAVDDCPPLSVTVDGQAWPGMANQLATLHRTLDVQTGYYDEALEVSVSLSPQSSGPDTIYNFYVDVELGSGHASVAFARTGGFFTDLATTATVLPQSQLDPGGTVHVCIAPGTGVIGLDSTVGGLSGKRVEVSGRIDAVIEGISVHNGSK
jgi:hypothetical protein